MSFMEKKKKFFYLVKYFFFSPVAENYLKFYCYNSFQRNEITFTVKLILCFQFLFVLYFNNFQLSCFFFFNFSRRFFFFITKIDKEKNYIIYLIIFFLVTDYTAFMGSPCIYV